MCPLQSKYCPFVLNQFRTLHPVSRNFNPGGFECCNSSWENVSLVTYKILVTFYAILTSHLSQYINCVVVLHIRILELKTRAIMFWFKQGESFFYYVLLERAVLFIVPDRIILVITLPRSFKPILHLKLQIVYDPHLFNHIIVSNRNV